MEKAMSRTSNSNLHVAGESDGRIVPTKGPNGEGQLSKEGVEGRRPTKENIGQTPMARTQSRFPLYRGWDGVREAARKRGAGFPPVPKKKPGAGLRKVCPHRFGMTPAISRLAHQDMYRKCL